MDEKEALRLKEANKLFQTPPQFMLSVAYLEQLPPADKDEVAFAGRSNVGKSSLINALFNRKDVAKTSLFGGFAGIRVCKSPASRGETLADGFENLFERTR